MKLIFYTQDEELIRLAQGLSGYGAVATDEQDDVLDYLDEVEEDELCFLFLDFDFETKKTKKFNVSLFQNDWLIRYVVSADLKLKELKKHQKSKEAAHGYIRKPLTVEILNGILGDFQIAEFVEENEIIEEGSDLPPLPEMDMRADPSMAMMFDDDDDEPFEPAEMKVSTQVRTLITSHNTDGKVRPFEGKVNDKIQAQFDKVFGSAPDLSAPTPSEDLSPSPSMEEESSPGISLELPGNDLEDPPDPVTSEIVLGGGNTDPDSGTDEVAVDLDGGDDIDLDIEEDNDDDIDLLSDDEGELNMDLGSSEDDSEVQADSEVDLDDDEIELIEEEADSTPEEQSLSDEEFSKEDTMSGDDDLEFEVEEEELDDGVLEFGGGDESSSEAVEESEEVILPSEEDMELPDLGTSDDLVMDSGAETSEEIEDNDELDLGGDDDLEMDLDDSPVAEESSDINLEDDEFSIDDMGEGGGVQEVDSTKTTTEEAFVMAMDEEDASTEVLDTSDEVEQTLSDIIAPEGDEDFELEMDSGEEEVVEVEEEVIEEEDADEFGDLEDDIGENTNPTVVMTDGIQNQLQASETDSADLEEAEEVESFDLGEDEDGVDFGEVEEEDNLAFDTTDDDDEFGDLGDDDEELDPTKVMSPEDISRPMETMPSPGELSKITEEEELDGLLEDDINEEEEPLNIEPEPEFTPAPSRPEPTPRPSAQASEEGHLNITPEQERIPVRYNESELLRLQATIRQLREERDQLLGEIKEAKSEKKVLEQENLGLKAELDEAKIEISIMKKRHGDEIDEMKYRLRIGDEKRMISEEKSKKLQKEFDRLQQRVRVDFNQIKQREKELESKLELVKMDSESQVRSRDQKILELKRKIDQLEFNMENAVIKEQKSKDDKQKLEDRLHKIMKTLRGSIELLEEDLDFEEELKKRMDKRK